MSAAPFADWLQTEGIRAKPPDKRTPGEIAWDTYEVEHAEARAEIIERAELLALLELARRAHAKNVAATMRAEAELVRAKEAACASMEAMAASGNLVELICREISVRQAA